MSSAAARRAGHPALLVLALALGCSRETPPPLGVRFAGCAAALAAGPTCVLTAARTLTLWVPTPPETRVEIRAEGAPLTPRTDLAVREGHRYELELPDGATAVEVLRTGPGRRRASWRLAVAEPRPVLSGEVDVQGEIQRRTPRSGRPDGDTVYDHLKRLELAEARQQLETLSALAAGTDPPAESRATLAYYRGLLADKEGDLRSALAGFERAIAEAERGGLIDFAWDARQKLALLLASLGRAREAEEQFAALAADPRFQGACHEGWFLSNWAWVSLLAREAGLASERTTFERTRPESIAPGPMADAPRAAESPGARLERAIAKIRSDPRTCTPDDLLNARLNLVLDQLQTGRPDRAERTLRVARAEARGSTLFLQLWELDLEGRIDLARGRARAALARYERLARIAGDVDSLDGRLRASLGRARASNSLGQRERALAILADAETLLDGQSLAIPIDAGRGSFVEQREGVARLSIELLLDAGRTADALAAARRGASRVLRQLDVAERLASLPTSRRQAWNRAIARFRKARAEIERAAADEWTLLSGEVAAARAERQAASRAVADLFERALAILGPPRTERSSAPIPDGDLLLVFHPLSVTTGGGARWVAFAARTGTPPRAERFDLPEAARAEDLGAVLGRLDDEIAAAQRVRVVLPRALADLDLHALPLGRGRPLLAEKPVLYVLDLPEATARARRPTAARPRALIVADPSGDLPSARTEADAVEAALGTTATRWTIARLDGAAATVDRLGALLPVSALFHFSGHGRFGGVGGTDSSLLLAADRRLTAGDLLTLGKVPATVVLSGCETGRDDGLGLANAFVLAGADVAIGALRPIDDRAAAALFADFYARWRGQGAPTEPFRDALLDWRRRDPRADWASFRIVVP